MVRGPGAIPGDWNRMRFFRILQNKVKHLTDYVQTATPLEKLAVENFRLDFSTSSNYS